MKTFILILIIFGCSSPKAESLQEMPDLKQTKWSFKVIEGVYNYYEFTSETAFKYYSAELEDMFYGDYEVKNDTLYMSIYTSAGDSLLDENSPHISMKTREKFVVKDDKLQLVYNEYKHLKGWIPTKIPPNLFYIREN